MTNDLETDILFTYLDFVHCDEIDVLPFKDWLTTDLLRIRQRIDEELDARIEAQQ